MHTAGQTYYTILTRQWQPHACAYIVERGYVTLRCVVHMEITTTRMVGFPLFDNLILWTGFSGFTAQF